MDTKLEKIGGWHVELETKPNFDEAMERVHAWYEGELLDRPPLMFARGAAGAKPVPHKDWKTPKDRWYDTEFIVDSFVEGCKVKNYLAETFPIFWPNLGPNIFTAMYGVPYEFGEGTTWSVIDKSKLYDDDDVLDFTPPKFDMNNEYMKKLDEMTDYAIEKCRGWAIVGYTDLHPGGDWAAALKGNETLLLGLYSQPEDVKKLIRSCEKDFFEFYDHFDKKLKAAKQPSATWLGIPSFHRMHVPSCDFSYMISPEHFMEFFYDGLAAECEHMDENIFHIDGVGVARHTDAILTLPKLNAVQWVQGPGKNLPILQWVPYLKRIQESGKGIVISLNEREFDELTEAMSPKGLYLAIGTSSEDSEREIIKKAEKWTLGKL